MNIVMVLLIVSPIVILLVLITVFYVLVLRKTDLGLTNKYNVISVEDGAFGSQFKGYPDRINYGKDVKSQAKMLSYDNEREIPRKMFTCVNVFSRM